MRLIRKTLPPLLLALGASLANSAEFAPESLNGIWHIAKDTPALLTLEGEVPPLLPEAKAVYEQNQRDRANGDTYFDRATWCAGVGVPRLLVANHPFEIMVSTLR